MSCLHNKTLELHIQHVKDTREGQKILARHYWCEKLWYIVLIVVVIYLMNSAVSGALLEFADIVRPVELPSLFEFPLCSLRPVHIQEIEAFRQRLQRQRHANF